VNEAEGGRIDGLVHSIAYANYSEGLTPFHGTVKKDFLQAFDISCFHLFPSVIISGNSFRVMPQP